LEKRLRALDLPPKVREEDDLQDLEKRLRALDLPPKVP
jgi:hypothetical protein